MPSITSLALNGVLKNGTATNVTFTPVAPQNGDAPAEWRDMTQTVHSLQPSITGSIVRSKGSTPARKYRSTILIPVIRDVGGVATVVALNRADIDFRIADVSTENERKELSSTVAKYTDSGAHKSMVEQLLAQF